MAIDPAPQLREALTALWARLGPAHQAFFGGLQVRVDPACKHLADSGEFDVRLRPPLPDSMAALVGMLSHECGHMANDHAQRVACGELTPAAAEREADEWARSVGFASELAAARRWAQRSAAPG